MSTLNISAERPCTIDEWSTIGEYAFQGIDRHFQKFLKYKADVLLARHPEPVHKMRVGLRRLRTALTLFDTFVWLPPKLNRNISKLAKQLGKVRDLDVLKLFLQDFQNQCVSQSNSSTIEQQKIAQVLVQLETLRYKPLKLLFKMLNGPQYQSIVHPLSQWIEQPTYQFGAQWPTDLILPDLLLCLMADWLRHPGWLLDSPVTLPKRELHACFDLHPMDKPETLLHDLRKQTKRVRYQTELFTQFYGMALADPIQEFRTLQDLLGQLHDLSVFRTSLNQMLDSHWPQQLPLVEEYLKQKQTTLWQQWQSIQQTYLQAEPRTNLRSIIANPPY